MIRPEVIGLPEVFLGCKNHLWPIHLIHLFIHINVVVTFGVTQLSQQSLSSNMFSPLLMTGYFPSLIDNNQGGLFDQPSLTAHPDPSCSTTKRTPLKTAYSTVTNNWRLAKNFFRQLKAYIIYAKSTEKFVFVT